MKKIILKLKNKKTILILSFFFIFALVSVFINNAFFKPTELNSFIAAKIYKSPANVAFTDDNFYRCIIDSYNNYNSNSNDLTYTTNITEEQLDTIKNISCGNDPSKIIKNLVGIDLLQNLEKIEFNNNVGNIENVDLSKNLKLKEINLNHSGIYNISLPKTDTLQKINLTANYISNVDISNIPNLTSLNLNLNKISEIDLSTNLKLETLKLSNYVSVDTDIKFMNNNVTEIDLSNNIELSTLDIEKNNLTKIDLSKNENINFIELRGNKLSEIIFPSITKLSTVDLSKNNLENLDLSTPKVSTGYLTLNLSSNLLKELDLSNYVNKTIQLSLSNNNLTNLDLSQFDISGTLLISNNNIKSLDLSESTKINKIFADNNEIENINISNNSNLTYLTLNNNLITSLVLPDSNIQYLDVSNNKINSIIIPNLEYLKTLYANNNLLTNINLHNANLLESLNISNNNLTSLNVENLDLLTTIIANNNKLENINLTDNVELDYLNLSDNNISSLDVSSNSILRRLYLNNNKISYLNLSNNDKLEYIEMNNNICNSDDLVVYKNQYVDFEPKYTDAIILPSHAKLFGVSGIYAENATILNSNNQFKASDVGTFDAMYNISFRLNQYEISGFNVSQKLHVLSIDSNKYNINETNNYVFTDDEIDYETILSNINSNGNLKIDNGVLNVSYNDKTAKEFDIVNYQTDYTINDNIIYLPSNLTYSEFKSNFICNNCEYNIYSNSNGLIANDKIIYDNYYLNIIVNGSTIKQFTIKDLDNISIENITLNKDNITLLKGTSETLIATITPEVASNKKLIWTSSNNDVAAVNENGLVTGISRGRATITVSNEEGNIIDECMVTVMNSLNSDIESEKYILDNTFTINKLKDKLIFDNFITDFVVNSNVITKVFNNGTEIDYSKSLGTGYKLRTYSNDELINEYTLIISGDLDGNGQANASDILKMKMHILGKSTLENIIFTAGDIDESNSVNATDIIYLKRYILGKSENVWGS